MAVTLCNLLWFLSCLPSAAAFVAAAFVPRLAQRRILLRILRRNAGTDYGQRHGFGGIRGAADYAQRVPVSTYDDYRDAVDAVGRDGGHERIVAEPVRVLEPTSGSGGAAKLVPYTDSLRREFLGAIRPWLAALYIRTPALFRGRQYWSVSPNTRPEQEDGGGCVPVGFADDTEYLGVFGRWVARHVLAAPAELARVTDASAFQYATLLFLVRCADLRLISVWHPSFLTILLDALPQHWPQLLEDVRRGGIRPDLPIPDPVRTALTEQLRPLPRRAEALVRVDLQLPGAPMRVWPRVRVISCWTEGAEAWISRLRAAFPRARIEGKGLIATEGIVTVPVGRRDQRAVAVRSHFLEFVDAQSGVAKPAWQLTEGAEYTVLLTTGGGFYRYCLHDRVRVEGRFLRTPCLRFLGREGVVSDMVGEKVDVLLADEALAAAQSSCGAHLSFAMLAPHRDDAGGCGYVCYAAGDVADRLADALERELQRAFHYRHARRLGQLLPARVFELSEPPDAAYQARRVSAGVKAGDVKFVSLSCEDGWHQVFRGHFVGDDVACFR